MWQNVWRSVLLWVLLPDVRLSVRILIREISLSYLEDVQDVTVSVVLPVLPRFIQKLLSKCAALRFRKVMLLLSVRSSVCSAVKKSAISSRNVMTLVQAVFPLLSVSWQQVLE